MAHLAVGNLAVAVALLARAMKESQIAIGKDCVINSATNSVNTAEK